MADYKLISSGDDESDNANLRLLMELGGGVLHRGTGRLIADLLRSHYMLTPTLRTILADAFDGSSYHLRKIELKRKKRGPAPSELPFARGVKKSVEYLRWGEFIANHPDFHCLLKNAITDACEEFDIQRSQAFDGLKFWRSWQSLQQS